MDPFVAEIRIFGFNFAPKGWATCDGQLLPISQNTALFSLLGTMYGGDGKSTFGLPALAGAAPMAAGTDPTASTTRRDGREPHGHADLERDTRSLALGLDPQRLREGSDEPGARHRPGHRDVRAERPTDDHAGAEGALDRGGSQPHNNMMPSLTFTICIALQGVYPARP